MPDHEFYMRRALELARRAEGDTSPNPMVGCVILDQDNHIVGEGWHRKAGTPHAEVNAIADMHARHG
ncbi:MAG: bifunctional diaminohydroxyphosphoribosylaminopyrimidine deaminase/5-amino-6-(5-phosphoribosylamino)uracil reductase, partial [Sporosarcina sp.]